MAAMTDVFRRDTKFFTKDGTTWQKKSSVIGVVEIGRGEKKVIASQSLELHEFVGKKDHPLTLKMYDDAYMGLSLDLQLTIEPHTDMKKLSRQLTLNVNTLAADDSLVTESTMSFQSDPLNRKESFTNEDKKALEEQVSNLLAQNQGLQMQVQQLEKANSEL